MALSQRSNSALQEDQACGPCLGWGRGHWSSLPGRLQAQRVPLGRWSLLGPRALKEYKNFPEVCAFPLEPVGGSYAGHREVRKLGLVTRGFSTCYKPILYPALRPRWLCSALHHSEKHTDSEDPYQSHCARIYLPPFLDLEIL